MPRRMPLRPPSSPTERHRAHPVSLLLIPLLASSPHYLDRLLLPSTCSYSMGAHHRTAPFAAEETNTKKREKNSERPLPKALQSIEKRAWSSIHISIAYFFSLFSTLVHLVPSLRIQSTHPVTPCVPPHPHHTSSFILSSSPTRISRGWLIHLCFPSLVRNLRVFMMFDMCD